MRTLFVTFAVWNLCLVALSVPIQLARAEETYTLGTVMTTATFRFNNENWFTAPHPKIASFTIRDDRSSYGLTETGVPFTQYNIPNDVGIRIQRFEIQDHYHYIVAGEIAYTFEELSVQLARAYGEQVRNSPV